MTTQAIILAAGFSSRAGDFKMAMSFGRNTVLQTVIEVFLPICSRVIVVGGFQWERLVPLIKPYGEQVTLVVNDHYEQGMFSSVQVGVHAVKGDRFFITPGDYPLLTTDVCRALLASGADYAIPSYDQRGGHPVLLPIRAREAILKEDAATGNLKSFLQKRTMVYVPVDASGILYDLDTPSDYMTLKAMARDSRKNNQ